MPSLMACSAAVIALISAAPAWSQAPGGQSRSTFVPRADVKATPAVPITATKVIPVQATTPPAPTTKEDAFKAYVRLDPPGKEKLFGSRDTESELEERMRQEVRDTNRAETILFPEKPTLTDEAYKPRSFAPTTVLAEPAYVVHGRLYFEERNSERFGWEMGPLQPLISTMHFYKDVLLFPANFGSAPCRCWDTNAGICRPGDPVPYLCYPPEITVGGLLFEAGAVGAVAIPGLGL